MPAWHDVIGRRAIDAMPVAMSESVPLRQKDRYESIPPTTGKEHGLMNTARLNAALAGIALLACQALANAGINSWTHGGPDGGPEGGRVKAIAFHPVKSGTLLVSSGAGVFRSTNTGITWERTIAETQFDVTHLLFDPTNNERVAAVNQGVSWSTDGGQTFGPFYSTLNQNFLSGAFAVDGTLYITSITGRLFKTTAPNDYAEVAVPWTVPDGVVVPVAADPLAAGVLYAVIRGVGTYKSVNAGTSWTLLPGSPGSRDAIDTVWNIAIDPGNTQRLIASTSNGLMRSADGGQTWQTLLTGYFPAWVAFDPHVPDHALAVTFSGQVMKSSDGGASWPSPQWTQLRTNYIEHLAFDPTEPNRVFIGTSDGPMHSANGGLTFDVRTAGIHAGRAQNFSAAADGVVYAGMIWPAGVFRRDAQWLRVNNEPLFASPVAALNLAGVSTTRANSNVVYAADLQGRVLRSVNGGATWGISSPDIATKMLYDIAAHPVDPNVVHVATGEGLWRSSDGGVSWQPGSGTQDVMERVVVSVSNPQVLYASSTNRSGWLFRSTNGGLSWQAATTPSDGIVWALDVDPGDASTVFAVVFDLLQPRLFKSTNGGDSWTEVPVRNALGGTYSIGGAVLVDPTARNTWFVLSNAAHQGFVRSVDGGLNWEFTRLDVGGNIHYADAGVLHPSMPSMLIAGYEGQGVAEYTVATDMTVEFASPVPVLPTDGTGIFTLNLQNLGPHAASPARLRVSLPGWLTPDTPTDCSFAAPYLTCDVGAMQVGQLRALQVVVNTTGVESTGVLSVQLTTHETDTNPANNAISADAQSLRAADLALTTSADGTAVAGGTVSRSATITNHGPGPSATTTLRFNAPASLALGSATSTRGTCTVSAAVATCEIGELANGATATVTLTGTVTLAGTAEISASVTGSAPDIVITNNSAALRTTVTAPPPPAAPGNAGGGGGGSLEWLGLCLLGLLTALRGRVAALPASR
jgi:hypothetical protein